MGLGQTENTSRGSHDWLWWIAGMKQWGPAFPKKMEIWIFMRKLHCLVLGNYFYLKLSQGHMVVGQGNVSVG